VQWMGRQAAVTLPEHIDVSNAGSIGEELLSVINRGATVLIADMAATVSCDDAGVDAVVRAHQRAVAKGTQLRLVVTAQTVPGCAQPQRTQSPGLDLPLPGGGYRRGTSSGCRYRRRAVPSRPGTA
jgi:hypothetical protein